MEKIDKTFIELYIRSFAIVSPNTNSAINDINSKEFLYATHLFHKLIQYKKNVEGRKLRDLPIYAANFADQYKEVSNKVKQTNLAIKALIVHKFEKDALREIKLLEQKPIINTLNGKTVALETQISDFHLGTGLANILTYINQKIKPGDQFNIGNLNEINLSKRQHEVLFLLLLGKSPKNIADFISKFEQKTVTPATITAIINKQLYLKFNVSSMDNLIEKAIFLGFSITIPPSFIHTKDNEGVLMYL